MSAQKTKSEKKKAATKSTRQMKVAKALVDAIAKGGVPPWVAPWDQNGGLPKNIVSKKRYSGFNSLVLWWRACERGFASPWWMTLRQVHDRGGRVRPGQRSTPITTYWFTNTQRRDRAGLWVGDSAPVEGMVKLYNFDQTEGVRPPNDRRGKPSVVVRDARIESWLRLTRAPIVHGGARAYYSQRHDKITMPEVARFESSGAYYATLLHELIHYTGHESRVNRDLEGRFGDPSYAKEELVAELGAAFLCAEFGVPGELRHAAYLKSWLEPLSAEPALLMRSASAAQNAIGYLEAVVEGRPTARYRRKRRKRREKTAPREETLALAS